MRRGDSIYRPKPRKQQIDEFIHHVAVEGAPDPAAAAKRLKALGPLSAAEKRQIERGTRQRSGQTQQRVQKKFVRDTKTIGKGIATAATFPLTGQTIDETARAVRRNLSRGNQGDPRRLAVENQGLSIGMAMWVPGGNPLRRAGSKVWNNKRLVEKAEESVSSAVKRTPKTPEEKLVGSMSSARRLRKQQEVLRSRERAKRAEALDRALMENPGEAGRQAALAELKGELPKLQFGALKRHEITAADVHRFEQTIRTHPELLPYEKLNTERALHRVLGGTVPTKGDVKLIRRVFGDAKAAEIEQHVAFSKRALESAVNLVNVPRALQSSMDISHFFRQGLLYFTAHPVKAIRTLPRAVKSAREAHYNENMGEIYADPDYELMERGGLALTDTENLVTREEAFIGANYAEKINPGVPGHPKLQLPIGKGVKASGQMYTGGLNRQRYDWAKLILAKARQAGYDVENEKFLKESMGKINILTGRGSLGSHENAVKSLNLLLFSPRLIASRLQVLFDPRMYVGRGWEGEIARQEARKSAAGLIMLGGSVLMLAKQAGADVGIDPRSSDFGRIKFGNTRIDIWGGLQAYVVAAYRILSGEKVNSATDEVKRVVDDRDGADNYLNRARNVGVDLLENKLSPTFSYLNQYRIGRTFEGDPFNPPIEAGRALLPIGWKSAWDTAREEGVPPAAIGLAASTVGFGANTYGAKEPKKKGKSRGSRGGGNSIYRGGGGSNSGSIYRR